MVTVSYHRHLESVPKDIKKQPDACKVRQWEFLARTVVCSNNENNFFVTDLLFCVVIQSIHEAIEVSQYHH